jgi:tRNA (adenine-N(1)-)-methyltransferase non-catalytic subunit
MSDSIKIGQYIIVQRQNFTKLHRFTATEATLVLGKDEIKLNNIEGKEYFQTFKMKPVSFGKRRLCELELCDNIIDLKEILNDVESGSDNRNIHNDSQVNNNKFFLFSFDLLVNLPFCSHKYFHSKR